jgi:quinol monooxygenase YgiN
MAEFVQIIEFSTSRFDEMEKFNDEWRRRHRDRGYNWLVLCADRDNPGKYLALVEFDSYQAAMANNEDPATREFAEKMMELSDGPPVFRNLDVVRTEGMS